MTLRLGKQGVYCVWEEVIETGADEPLRVTRAERLNLARIDDRVLGSVIYLYPTVEEAKEGRDPKDLTHGGSGFLLSVQSEAHPNHFHVYAVSNKHVVRANGYAPVIRGTMVRMKGSSGTVGIRNPIPLASNQWKPHDDADIAITSLGLDEALPSSSTCGRRFGFTFPSDLLLTKPIIEAFDIGPGDDVYMCGRFAPHAGKDFNNPSTRWGTIALMPGLVELDEGEEEVFLIEMRSLAGFSGSPVAWRIPTTFELLTTLNAFAANKPSPNIMTRQVKPEIRFMPMGPWLIGIECGMFPYYYPVYEVQEKRGETIRSRTEEPRLEAKSHSGVAAVVPAWKLQELLNLEEFDMARKEEDEKLTRKKQSGRFDRESVSGDDELPSLTRRGFDDVLRRVSRKTSEPESENKAKRKP